MKKYIYIAIASNQNLYNLYLADIKGNTNGPWIQAPQLLQMEEEDDQGKNWINKALLISKLHTSLHILLGSSWVIFNKDGERLLSPSAFLL